jgi:sulfoxide reductase heme-binding subunit YedZ|tara:strand:- start:496 stop:1098 length:603 start_codon:yes stop_codon:yes gene_type:complete
MRKLIKPLVFAGALIPFSILIARVFVYPDSLGPDPAQELAKESGEWALRFLVITLALTPLRQITDQVEFVRQRRMLGLFALFYATIHFMVWVAFLLVFRWAAIVEELVKRPFITIGFAAFLILIALGVTSTKSMVRKLGRNWKRLHRLVYLAAGLAVVHLLWILRTNIGEAVFYGALVALLLAYRLQRHLRASKPTPPKV